MTSNGRLAGKVALVTGAGAAGTGIGIGRAIAMRFAAEGATVVAADRVLAAAETTVAMIADKGGKSEAIKADVRTHSEVEAMVSACLAAHGRVDILVNSVGGGKPGGVVDTSPDEWLGALDLNLTSAFLCSRSVLPSMAEAGRGAIVHVGSLFGVRYPGTDMIGYAVAKAGLAQLSRCIALEFAGRGIRSNCLLVGAADTPEIRRRMALRYGAENVDAVMDIRAKHVPVGQSASVWEVASAALYLASDEASHVTGTELAVDGGAGAVTVPSYVPEADTIYGRT
jgi:NAD(P)-dependent dehydrogenase (short-subunit alcohol dehydrogenase family)